MFLFVYVHVSLTFDDIGSFVILDCSAFPHIDFLIGLSSLTSFWLIYFHASGEDSNNTARIWADLSLRWLACFVWHWPLYK